MFFYYIKVTRQYWRPMTSHPLVQVFEAMMEKRQIPNERFLMTKKKRRKNGASKGPNTETVLQ
jgi:hypothetical protein